MRIEDIKASQRLNGLLLLLLLLLFSLLNDFQID